MINPVFIRCVLLHYFRGHVLVTNKRVLQLINLTKSEYLPQQYSERPNVTLCGVDSIKQCLDGEPFYR